VTSRASDTATHFGLGEIVRFGAALEVEVLERAVAARVAASRGCRRLGAAAHATNGQVVRVLAQTHETRPFGHGSGCGRAFVRRCVVDESAAGRLETRGHFAHLVADYVVVGGCRGRAQLDQVVVDRLVRLEVAARARVGGGGGAGQTRLAFLREYGQVD